jgi:hypothetical protein
MDREPLPFDMCCLVDRTCESPRGVDQEALIVG